MWPTPFELVEPHQTHTNGRNWKVLITGLIQYVQRAKCTWFPLNMLIRWAYHLNLNLPYFDTNHNTPCAKLLLISQKSRHKNHVHGKCFMPFF